MPRQTFTLPSGHATCPEHQGAGFTMCHDISKLVVDGNVWLWKRSGYVVEYECSCELRFRSAIIVNTSHPVAREIGVNEVRRLAED